MRKLVLILGGAAAALLCLGAVIIMVFLLPPVGTQLPSGSAPLVAHITAPTSSDAPAGQVIRVQVSATSANPITELQLWVNGVHIASQTAPADTRSARMSFDWLPETVGANLVLIRAVDSKGYSADSAPLRLNIGREASNALTSPLRLPSDEGDTLTTIASELGLPPEVVYTANPDLPTDEPLPAGSEVNIPLEEAYNVEPETVEPSPTLPPPAEPVIPADSQPAPALGPIVPITLFFASFGSLPDLPAAPDIIAKQNGCTVDITIIDASDDESGFFLYEMTPGSPGFVRVGEFGAQSSNGAITTSRPAEVGNTIYKAAAFNSAGEAQSEMVSIVISDSTCGSSDFQLVTLDEAQITLTEPAERVYCYASPDAVHWVRLPEGDDSFYFPTSNVIDLADDVGPIGAVGQPNTLSLECWGWSSGVLKSLGAASGPIPDAGDVEIIAQAYTFTATSAGGFPYGGLPITVITPQLPLLPDQQIVPPHTVKAQVADNGSAAVSWLWINLGCVPDKPCTYIWDIDGFKVYDKNGTLVTTVSAGDRAAPASDQGAADFDQCYTVTAYKGEVESAPSAPGCVQPPSANPPHSVIEPNLAPPTNVTLTGDGAVCVQHVQGFLLKALIGPLCEEATKNNQYVLVWDWSPKACFPDLNNPCDAGDTQADGFTVYIIENGRPYLIEVIDNVEQTAAILPPDIAGIESCFLVRAYKGFYESADSMSTCGTPVPPPQLSAQPSKYVGFELMDINNLGDGLCSDTDNNSGWRQFEPTKDAFETLSVGFTRINETGGCNTLVTMLEAGGVAFRIDGWAGYPIEKAVFEFQHANSMTVYKGQSIGADTSWDSFASTCLKRVYESNSALLYWYDDTILSTGPFSSDRDVIESYDVTELLKQRIAQGNQVIRFVLEGDQSVAVNHPGYLEICWSQYHNFRLNVTFGDLQ